MKSYKRDWWGREVEGKWIQCWKEEKPGVLTFSARAGLPLNNWGLALSSLGILRYVHAGGHDWSRSTSSWGTWPTRKERQWTRTLNQLAQALLQRKHHFICLSWHPTWSGYDKSPLLPVLGSEEGTWLSDRWLWPSILDRAFITSYALGHLLRSKSVGCSVCPNPCILSPLEWICDLLPTVSSLVIAICS